jgi:uncharacterized membrane protein
VAQLLVYSNKAYTKETKVNIIIKKIETMKTLKLIAVGIILLVSSSIQAQVSVSLNIGTAPSWDHLVIPK